MKVTAGPSGVYTLGHFGPTVLAAFSGRDYPASRRSDFLRELGLSPEALFMLKQVHSANLVLVKSDQKPDGACQAEARADGKQPDAEPGLRDREQADGMLTAAPGFTLGILTADCVPVFFCDPERRVTGIAHAGWRGIYQGIIPKMIQAMRQNFGTKGESLRVALGPAIRKCCYKVGDEFRDLFPQFYDEGQMDLIAAISSQLAAEGVSADKIFDTGICTSCENDHFFSARREKGTSERILSVIQIRL